MKNTKSRVKSRERARAAVVSVYGAGFYDSNQFFSKFIEDAIQKAIHAAEHAAIKREQRRMDKVFFDEGVFR